MKPIKRFLNKPANEATNADVLITHAATVTIGILVGATLTMFAKAIERGSSQDLQGL